MPVILLACRIGVAARFDTGAAKSVKSFDRTEENGVSCSKFALTDVVDEYLQVLFRTAGHHLHHYQAHHYKGKNPFHLLFIEFVLSHL
jgi:hypothetical protein